MREGRLIGVVTDGDLRRHMGGALLALRVRQVMHRSPKTIGAGASGGRSARADEPQFAITALFVVDQEGRPIGFLHMHDCLRAGVA